MQSRTLPPYITKSVGGSTHGVRIPFQKILGERPGADGRLHKVSALPVRDLRVSGTRENRISPDWAEPRLKRALMQSASLPQQTSILCPKPNSLSPEVVDRVLRRTIAASTLKSASQRRLLSSGLFGRKRWAQNSSDNRAHCCPISWLTHPRAPTFRKGHSTRI